MRDALEVGAAHAAVLEVVVCDDGSRDDTAEIAAAVAARDARVVVYAQARHAWVFLNSADRQWPMAVLGPVKRPNLRTSAVREVASVLVVGR